MPRIPDAFIREVLERVDLVQLIGRHVQLKKSGTSTKGLCPFHGEKTPSFYVHPDKGFYHCFGCSAHGNALDFLMQHEQIPFLEAIERLAQMVGMDVPRSEQMDKEHQRRAYINDRLSHAQRFFVKALDGAAEARHYLFEKRGLKPEVVERFGVGYAPSSGQALLKTFSEEDNRLLQDLGLVSEYDSRRYARFRHRITFPIRDERGRLIAFGARALSREQSPKYLNTVFDKHLYLYGLYEAIQAKHASKILIVVEGYLDVMMMAQHGLTNAVAGLGTAIGVKQVKLLFRYSQKILFCFDGDKAGYAAAEKALRSVLSVLSDGVEVKFVFLPEKEDPDSLLRKKGKAALMESFQNGLTLEQFFLKALHHHYPSESLAHQASRGKLGMSWLEGMPNGLMRHLLTQKLADMLEVDEGAVEQLMPSADAPSIVEKSAPDEVLRVLTPLQYVLSLLLQNPQGAAEITLPDWLQESDQRDCLLIKNAVECSISSSIEAVGTLIEHWRGKADEAYIKQLAFWQHVSDDVDWQDAVQDGFRQAELSWISNQIEALLSKAREAELSSEASEALVALMKRKNVLKSGNG